MPAVEANTAQANVKQAVPFFMVSNIQNSLRFYIHGLRFEITNKWIDEGELRWCWLKYGGAALMLQQYRKQEIERLASRDAPFGVGVSVYFICEDAVAIYREVRSRRVKAGTPFVGNSMWVTSINDPDGYRILFESPTDMPEETVYSGI